MASERRSGMGQGTGSGAGDVPQAPGRRQVLAAGCGLALLLAAPGTPRAAAPRFPPAGAVTLRFDVAGPEGGPGDGPAA